MNIRSKILAIVLLLAPSIAVAQNARYDNVAFTSSGLNAAFITNATITVCTSAGSGLPCTPKVSGLCLSASDVSCTQPNPTTSDALGNYGFWIQPGKYVVTVTKAGLGGYSTTLTLPCDPTAACTVTGTATFTGATTTTKLNSVIYLDGVTYTTLATCYAAIPIGGGACVVPPNYSETMTASLTVNKANTGFIFMGVALITMGTNQIIVPGGTHGVFFQGLSAYGGTNVDNAVQFTYAGSGKAFQIGDSSATSRAFTWKNIKITFAGASAPASGLYMTNVVYFELINPSVIGQNVAGTFGIVCDGTGNFCGTGSIINPILAFIGTGLLGTGTCATCMNAVTILGGTAQSAATGAIGIDIEGGDGNVITSIDLESNSIGVKLGATATNNHILFRAESNTTDVTALTGSNSNIVRVQPITGNPIVKSDSGTNNHISLAIDGDFRALSVGQGGTPGTASLYSASFSRSIGNPAFPDIIGNGSQPVAVGDSFGAISSGPYRAKQQIADQGSVCTNGELALSAGWQSTGSATVTAVAGNGQTCSWTITTGTTTAANPTVTDTLTNALPAATTVCEMNIHGGTHTAAAGEGFQQTTLSATAPVFTFNGTPTAGGTTYFVTRRCGP